VHKDRFAVDEQAHAKQYFPGVTVEKRFGYSHQA
jgi:hypothetical protein